MFRKKTETATFAAAGKTEVTNSYEAASRVSFWNLEIVYYLEPIMHAGIDLYQKLVLYAGYHVTSKDRHTKSILEMLRHQTSFDEVFLEKVPLHLGIYGNAFIELLKLRNDRKKNHKRHTILYLQPIQEFFQFKNKMDYRAFFFLDNSRNYHEFKCINVFRKGINHSHYFFVSGNINRQFF